MPPRRCQGAKTWPEGAFDIPDAIWENIATCMSIKDWAKASGTCRITSKLQLQKIDIPSGTPEEGVVWVTKRLASVETLRLRANCAEQLVLATGHGSLALRRLRHLLIETPEATRGNITFEPMLAWLLSRAENLQLLSAAFGNIFYFPPMTQLKHLILTFDLLPESLSMFNSMSHAVSLETLRIDCREIVQSPGPSLNLKNLKSLQRLAIKFVRPTELQVWESCSVFVEGPAVLRMSEDDWCNKWSADRISYLKCVDRSSELLRVPASFPGFENLQDVHLLLGRLGKEGASVLLQDGLANVRRLCIDADNLFITVPAKVKWEEVWFGGNDALCITFGDMNAFVSSGCRFALRYKSRTGSWLPNLCQCLAANGLRHTVRDLFTGKTLLFWGRSNLTKCVCGACLKCLAPSQNALSDWAT